VTVRRPAWNPCEPVAEQAAGREAARSGAESTGRGRLIQSFVQFFFQPVAVSDLQCADLFKLVERSLRFELSQAKGHWFRPRSAANDLPYYDIPSELGKPPLLR
jgi:hypothetical protein